MIDDKTIEEAARGYANTNGYFGVPEAYNQGAHWAINKFLTDLWHSASEEPKEGFDLVCINKAKEFREISSYNSDRFNDLFGKGWEAACRRFGIHKWTYKDDLL